MEDELVVAVAGLVVLGAEFGGQMLLWLPRGHVVRQAPPFDLVVLAGNTCAGGERKTRTGG